MSIIEARSRYRRPAEIKPILTGGEDEGDDFENLSDEQLLQMATEVFLIGHVRKENLDKVLSSNSSGDYIVPHASTGQYADFYDQANFKYLQKKYPWLHEVNGGIGIDDDKAEQEHESLEKFLAKIPDSDWEDFLTDMQGLEDYPSLDDDLASELEMEEQGRWMTEDGGPDLIKAMVKDRADSYESYLLSKVTPDMIWEWSRETDNYPESQGEGSVWMDMDKLGKDTENQDWFLDQIDDDVAGWLALKRACYDDLISDPEGNIKPQRTSDAFDALLREMATLDEQIATVYNRVDAAMLWQMFLEAFPDDRREESDPYWYQWKPRWDAEAEWRVGYAPEGFGQREWVRGYKQALEHLMVVPWFHKLIASWFNRPPEGHPELKFESVREALEPELDPDDPEVFMRHGGGLREELIYEDSQIKVFYPRDIETLNYHLRRMGYPEVSPEHYRITWYGNQNDSFIIVAKEGSDLLGWQNDQHEIGALVGDREKLVGYNGTYHVDILNNLLAEPRYGKSIKRMLLRYYREQAAHNDRYAYILMQLGGPAEIRRRAARGDFDISPHEAAIGLHYVAKHKYRLAAKAFGRPLNTLTPTGVWLIYDSVEDLTPVFKNEDAASTVFANDHHDWFSHYWEKGNRPDVSDVMKFLSPKAIAHIREILVNRRVWFPDGGPDGEGEYVLLRKKLLDGYDDETILDWIEKPSEQDAEDGVFDDIREAIQDTGIQLLASASQDEVYTGFIKAAVDAIDGREHKWGTHPTKATKYGPSDTFEVYVPWSSVKSWVTDYRENNSEPYEGSLEDLAVAMNRETIEPDPDNMEASWRDINKDYAAEQMDRILELEAPELEPQPDDRNQIQLPLGEGEAEEEAHAQALMREHGVDKPDYDLAAAEKKADERGDTQFRKRQVAQSYLRKLRGEAIDPDAGLDVNRYVDDLAWEMVLRRNGFTERTVGCHGFEQIIRGNLYSIGEATDSNKLLVVIHHLTGNGRWQNNHMETVPKGQIWQWLKKNVGLTLEALDPDSPEAMGDSLLSGVRVEFENQVKAILKDSTTAHQYTVRDLSIKLEPSQEYSEEDVDASDGRLYNRAPHLLLFVSYLTEPERDWDVTMAVYKKVESAAVNVYREFSVTDGYVLNPISLADTLPEDLTIFRFSLYDIRTNQVADVDDQTPF